MTGKQLLENSFLELVVLACSGIPFIGIISRFAGKVSVKRKQQVEFFRKQTPRWKLAWGIFIRDCPWDGYLLKGLEEAGLGRRRRGALMQSQKQPQWLLGRLWGWYCLSELFSLGRKMGRLLFCCLDRSREERQPPGVCAWPALLSAQEGVWRCCPLGKAAGWQHFQLLRQVLP